MRPIHLARLDDKTRPVLILTRSQVIPYLKWVTIAPITSSIRGLTTEVAVGPANGLDHQSVVNLDNVTTIPRERLGRHLGYLLAPEESALAAALVAAFALEGLS